MNTSIVVGIALIFLLGICAQWIAWRFRFPSILLLLLVGFTTGPILGLLNPDLLFGDLLFPIVSICVAIILFEGGLGLRFSELGNASGIVFRLITVGVIVTGVVGAVAAHYFLDLDVKLSVLLGSIITVSGPTVVLPLLRHIRPRAPLDEILKWEGILIDPVGALLAVLVFEAILAGEFGTAQSHIFYGILQALLSGTIVGGLAALFLGFVLRKHLIPDFLKNPTTLSLVIGTHVLANAIYPESGLLAVTLMGVMLANTKNIAVKSMLEFKEDLRVLIISCLFIALSARITLEQIAQLEIVGSIFFVAVLLFIARPASVFFSVIGSKLTIKEALFLSWLAPRGIVAAAVSSLFSLELVRAGHSEAELLVPYVFLVIVCSVTIYGLSAGVLAKFLKVNQSSPQGVLFLGSNMLSRAIASQLQNQGVQVLIADTNYNNVSDARADSLPVHFGNILSGDTLEELPLDGIGKLFAMTPNDDANALAALHCSHVFESANVFQLSPTPEKYQRNTKDYPMHLRGRNLFSQDVTFHDLMLRLERGGTLKTTNITEEYTNENYKADHGEDTIPLLVISADRELKVFTHLIQPVAKAGDKIISLI